MSSIKAVSDAAFLEISSTKTDSGVTWSNLTSVEIKSAEDGTAKDLLPARVKNVTTGVPAFETAHALAPTAAAINNETVKAIDAENKVYGESESQKYKFDNYIWHTTVYVRAQSGSYTNLTLDNLSLTAANEQANGLLSAGRVLAVCKDSDGTTFNYQLRSSTGTEQLTGAATYLYTGDLTGDTYATVELYYYYDGDAQTVYTNNLDKLGAISATVGFAATQN